jgi:hypothetical protein
MKAPALPIPSKKLKEIKPGHDRENIRLSRPEGVVEIGI